LFQGFIDDVAWSSDGDSMAVLRRNPPNVIRGTIEIWDVSDLGNPVMLRSFDDENMIDESPRELKWHPSDSLLAVSGMGVRLWNTDSGTLVRTLQLTNSVLTLEWSPDGSRIASSDGGKILQVWDTATGTLQHDLEFPLSGVQFAWGNDSQHIAVNQSSLVPEEPHEVHFIDLLQPAPPTMIIARDSSIGLNGWQGNSMTIFVRGIGGFEVLDVPSQQVLATIVDYEGAPPALSPDGTQIAYSGDDGTFHVIPVPGTTPTCDPAFTIADGDTTALISAITTANGTPEADTICLAESGTYTFTAAYSGSNALPPITSEITFDGNNATLTRDVAAPEFRLIQVESAGTLTLNDLTLSNGDDNNSIFLDAGAISVARERAAACVVAAGANIVDTLYRSAGGGVEVQVMPFTVSVGNNLRRTERCHIST
jgi:WD40 repeat protein